MYTIEAPVSGKEVTRNTKSIFRILQCKCPRCREGNMFKNRNPFVLKETMKMNDECPVCSQPFNLEVGFYFGSSYISYALTIALSVATFIAFWVIFGIAIDNNNVFYWLAFNSVFLLAIQPYLMRVARAGWLALFVKYNPLWRTTPAKKPERVNKDQELNW